MIRSFCRVTCNNCGFFEDYDVDFGFKQMLEVLKEDEWYVIKEGDKWKHYCTDCGEDFM